MGLFGRRKPPTTARRLLFDPVLASTVAGVDHVEVDYDPAFWIRCPGPGVDRTLWVEQVLAAWTEDLGWSVGDEAHERLRSVLDATADDPSGTGRPTLVGVTPDVARSTVATVDLLDEELMLLEHGEVEAWLSLVDVAPESPSTVRTFVRDIRFGSLTQAVPVTQLMYRAHRPVAVGDGSVLHVAVSGLGNDPQGGGLIPTLVARTAVVLVGEEAAR